jgi:tetratricopeptide (TPR) repeat protein
MPNSLATQIQINADALFFAVGGTEAQSRLSALSQSALSTGTTLYQKGNFAEAAKQFRKAISLDPSQSNAVKAYNLLATAYIADGKNDEAIKAYKSSLKVDPTNDATYVSLGNIYFNQGNYTDAVKQYESAVKNSPTSSADIYSLAQGYLSAGRYKDAEAQFQKVIRMSPKQYSGYYGLGQTYSKEGNSQAAIAQFQKVISLKPNFYNVYVDLGSAYADLGKTDDAKQQLRVLQQQSSDSTMASTLSSYITKVTKPKFMAAYSTSGFIPILGPHTLVTALDSSLAAPNASKTFNMTFFFTKQMDASSVQNILNWSITKAAAGSPGGAYNWGMAAPATDVPLPPIPVSVQYDSQTQMATLSFKIAQDAAADGTIDPSHIQFKFSGKDVYGNTMDASGDQYSGISMIV